MDRKAAFALVLGAIATGIAPDKVVQPSVWAAENLIVADGPKAGSKWDPSLTPQLPEILDCLAIDNPCTEVAVKKSGQVGMTGLGIAWAASVIVNNPAKAMIVFPTKEVIADFNREKLQPTIDQTTELKRKVSAQVSRSSKGSTALSKKFPGGSLVLVGANSSADLRSKTIKYMFCDEVDDWPHDLAGQGDPMEMVDARQISFHDTGEYKKFMCSTPTIKDESRIDEAFEKGDQRFWYVKCPHCDHEQILVFKNLIFEKQAPYKAFYKCNSGNGCVIDHYMKKQMVSEGRWIATNPGPGRYPSFFINSLVSLLTTWDKIAEKFINAKDNPKKLKAFVNLWLGEVWEEKGDAPEVNNLMLRREEFPPKQIPVGGVVLTAAVDVQSNGLFYEVVAWGDDKHSWSIDVGFLEGDTATTDGDVWKELTKLYEREYPDSYGNKRPIDLMGVDSGYNTNQVYNFCRRHPKAMALKGMPGWFAPPLGLPSKQEVSYDGQKIKNGVLLWPVGTWSLKSELYANLRKHGKKDGEEIDPPGYCYFSNFHDENFFKQLTSEHLKERTVRGRSVKEWVASGPNHLHDTRIYNMALAAHLEVGTMRDDEWDEVKRIRTAPPAPDQGDLLSPHVSRPRADISDEETVSENSNQTENYLDRQSGYWS